MIYANLQLASHIHLNILHPAWSDTGGKVNTRFTAVILFLSCVNASIVTTRTGGQGNKQYQGRHGIMAGAYG
jgi:hypothetical protein